MVTVEHLSKHFRLPHQQYSTLKERALHPFRARTFDTLRAVDDVSFEVGNGEFFGIVGRNGSGKSTLLKCLAGIYKTDTGHAVVHGRLSPFIELGVGFNPDLTARDNVIINAIMLLAMVAAREHRHLGDLREQACGGRHDGCYATAHVRVEFPRDKGDPHGAPR